MVMFDSSTGICSRRMAVTGCTRRTSSASPSRLWPLITATSAAASCMPWSPGFHTGRYNFLHGAGEPFDDPRFRTLQEHGIYTYLGKVLDPMDELDMWKDTLLLVAPITEFMGRTGDRRPLGVLSAVGFVGPESDGGRVDAALHYHFDWAATLIGAGGAGKLPRIGMVCLSPKPSVRTGG